jgi:hypothetical protein
MYGRIIAEPFRDLNDWKVVRVCLVKYSYP